MTRKPPTRTCIACGKSADKRDLLRVVRTPEGLVRLDEGGRAPGRGAYLCKDAACFEKAASKHLLEARLRAKVTSEDYEKLREAFCDLARKDARAQDRDGE